MIKKIAIYGDSISSGNYGINAYLNQLNEYFDFCYNHSIDGSSIVTHKNINTSLVEILDDKKNIHKDLDLIIIWYGTNDWYFSSNFYGDNGLISSLINSINKLKEASPSAKIILLTPLIRFQNPLGINGFIENAYKKENLISKTLNDVKNTLLEISFNNNILVLDIHKLSNINEENKDIFLVDDVHPNEKGYEIISQVIINFIENN